MRLPLDIDVDVDVADVAYLIDKMAERVSTPGLRAFQRTLTQPYFRDRILKRFQTEGDDAVGGPWIPLKDTTAMIRASQGYGAYSPINERTGALKRYVSESFSLNGSTLTIPRGTSSRVLKSKFKIAQLGGFPEAWVGKRTLGPSAPAPARPVLGLAERDVKQVESMLLQWVRS